MWDLSGAPDHPITGRDAERGVRHARAVVHEDVTKAAWDKMPSNSRRILAALGRMGPASPRDVASAFAVGLRGYTFGKALRYLRCGGFVSADDETGDLSNSGLIRSASVEQLALADSAPAAAADPASEDDPGLQPTGSIPKSR